MRVSLLSLLILTAAVSSAPVAGASGNPFAGWTEQQIAKHQARASSDILGKLSRYLTAKKKLVFKCQKCRGTGTERLLGAGGADRLIKCRTCGGTRLCVKAKYYRRVFWDFRSPAYRADPDRRIEAEANFNQARRDPKSLDVITGWGKKEVEVKGNFAVATFIEKRDDVETQQKLEWIEVDGKWWIAREESDTSFERFEYPKASGGKPPEPAPPEPADPGPADPGPQERPAPPETTAPEPAGSTAPEASQPKSPPEDPAKLFELGEVTIKFVEENAHKVMGRVRNKTKDRRFAYITVEVSLFKGDRLVETAECNVGTAILKAGESATFSGYIYAEKLPAYDRVEAKVSRFEALK